MLFGRWGKGSDTTGARGSSRESSHLDYSAATAAASATGLAFGSASGHVETASRGNRLVIGHGLTFNGDIEACTHLMIGGTVVSDVQLCDRLEISTSGSFQGTATVNDAEIAGQFEGELIVLGHLHLHGTGRVRGRITYGTLSVETGGRLLGMAESSTEAPRPQPRPVVVPLRPSAHTAGRDRNPPDRHH